MHTQAWKDYYIGQMVKAIGIPNAVGIVIAIYVTDINLCWLKVLWSDLGPSRQLGKGSMDQTI